MTSSDIYYRLGRIESNIEHLKNDVGAIREELAEARRESKAEHQTMRQEFKSEFKEIHAEIKELGSLVRQATEAGIIANTRLEGLEYMLMFCVGLMTLIFTIIMFRDSRRDKKSDGKTQTQAPANNSFVIDFNSLVKFFKSESQNNNN